MASTFSESSYIAIRKDAEAVLRLMNSTGRLAASAFGPWFRAFHVRYCRFELSAFLIRIQPDEDGRNCHSNRPRFAYESSTIADRK